MTPAAELELKLSLERQFQPEVRRVFNRIHEGFRVGVSTGNPVRAGNYKAQWAAVLTTHYTRVQKAFVGQVKQEDDDDDELIAALLAWAAGRSEDSATLITNTTQRNMDDALAQARQALSDEGRTDYSNQELAAVAVAILKRKTQGRESGIAVTETQAAAESTKAMGAYGLSGLDPMQVVTGGVTTGGDGTKTWMTVGDSRVRPAHAAAHGQVRRVDELFSVGGEKLLYPGDTSHGATLENIVNCRCSAVYSFGRI